MLCVRDVSVEFDGKAVLNHVSFDLPAGSMTALTGPSGSGKSTLLNCIGLLSRPTSGAIEFDGVDLTTLSPRQSARFRRSTLGYLFQDYALIENATVFENLELAMYRGGRAKPAKPQLAAALERVGLSGRLDERITRLSGGEQQRVALARVLVRAPRLVLADEPTGALDQGNGDAVVQLLSELASTGATVLIATHSDAVRDACDSIVALQATSSPERELLLRP